MSTQRKNSDRPLVTLDLCGLNCPAPLLGAKHVIDYLQPGQAMQLISDCPGTPDDLFAWSRHTGNEVIATDRLGGLRVAYNIRRGTGVAVRPTANVTLDMSGVSCPGPIVEAKKLLDGMKAGEVLQLVSDCPGSADDITSWAKAGAADLVFSHESGRGVHEFYLRRK